MHTSTSRKDKHEVVEIKVLLEGSLEDLDSDDDEFPTLHTNCLPRAAIPDIVVVIHVEIENKLSFLRFSKRFLLRNLAPNSPSIYLQWHLLTLGYHPLLHFLSIVKNNISLHGISLILKRQFSVIQRSSSIVG